MDDFRPPLKSDCLLRLSKEECKILYDFINFDYSPRPDVLLPPPGYVMEFLKNLQSTLEDFNIKKKDKGSIFERKGKFNRRKRIGRIRRIEIERIKRSICILLF